MHGCQYMDGQMYGCMDVCMDGTMYECIWMYVWMEGCTYGWMNTNIQMDACMYGWKEAFISFMDVRMYEWVHVWMYG